MKHLFTPLLALILMVTSTLALAAETMSAEEFDSYTRGKTFYYGVNGEEYGAEEYLPNNRVIWTFLDGQCQHGIWYEENGMICFEYERIETRQCWSFRKAPGGGLIARFQDDPDELELYEVQRTGEPLQCPGPEVGV